MPRLAPPTILLVALALGAAACDGEESCAGGLVLCDGGCRDAASFASDRDHCGACGFSCGVGTCLAGACQCDAGAACGEGRCLTEHANGLGQPYYDCELLDMHTRAQAELAAAAWSPRGSLVYPGRCAIGCLCTERTGEAAVWCYLGSGTRTGWVMLTPRASCPVAFCPDRGYGLPWH